MEKGVAVNDWDFLKYICIPLFISFLQPRSCHRLFPISSSVSHRPHCRDGPSGEAKKSFAGNAGIGTAWQEKPTLIYNQQQERFSYLCVCMYRVQSTCLSSESTVWTESDSDHTWGPRFFHCHEGGWTGSITITGRCIAVPADVQQLLFTVSVRASWARCVSMYMYSLHVCRQEKVSFVRCRDNYKGLGCRYCVNGHRCAWL